MVNVSILVLCWWWRPNSQSPCNFKDEI